MSGGILIVGDQQHPRSLELARELRGDIVTNPAALDNPVGFLARCLSGTVSNVIVGPDAPVTMAREIAHICSDQQLVLHKAG